MWAQRGGKSVMYGGEIYLHGLVENRRILSLYRPVLQALEKSDLSGSLAHRLGGLPF